MKRVTSFVHEKLLALLSSDAIICDLTCGHGNDSLFCAQHFKHVYALDIQEIAIQHTKEKLKDYANVSFILGSHAHLDQFNLPLIDAFIFNSGYLPHTDESLITQAHTTLTALEKIKLFLNKNALLIFTFYLKHPGGLEEYQTVYPLFKQLGYQEIERYRYDNDALSPIVHIFKQS